MKEPAFSAAEERYIRDLEKLPSSIRSRVLGWCLELIPSIGFFVYGLMSELRFYVVLGFLSLMYFSAWRMYGQLRGFRLLQSIYEKQLSSDHHSDG